MAPNPEDNQADDNNLDFPPVPYSRDDQRHDVIPSPQPLVPSSGVPSTTSLGGIYTPPQAEPGANPDDEDVIDTTWRYVGTGGPTVSSINPDDEPNADAGPAGRGARSGRRNPFGGPGAGSAPRPDAAPRRDPRDVEREAQALREANWRETRNKVVQSLLVAALMLGSGTMVGKIYNDLNNKKPAAGETSPKFDGTNLNSLLSLPPTVKVEPISNPENYAYPAPVKDASGQEIEGVYQIVTTTGESYQTGEGVEVGTRIYYPVYLPNMGNLFLVEEPGVRYTFAKVIDPSAR